MTIMIMTIMMIMTTMKIMMNKDNDHDNDGTEWEGRGRGGILKALTRFLLIDLQGDYQNICQISLCLFLPYSKHDEISTEMYFSKHYSPIQQYNSHRFI